MKNASAIVSVLILTATVAVIGRESGFSLERVAYAAAADSPPTKAPETGITEQLFADVVKGLRQTPGCLGADYGRLSSGKFAIFGWFESKAALMAWYKSDIHQSATDVGWPERDKDRVPMKVIAEDVGPVMAIACAIPIPKDELKPGQPEGTVRIGIEIYKPLPGGVRFGGGSFAPTGFKADEPAQAPRSSPSRREDFARRP